MQPDRYPDRVTLTSTARRKLTNWHPEYERHHTTADREVSNPRSPRGGWHGGAVQGAAPGQPRVREAGRDQEDPPAPRERSLVRGDVQRRGADHRAARSPAHRPGVR